MVYFDPSGNIEVAYGTDGQKNLGTTQAGQVGNENNISTSKPMQEHHFASNKNQTYTPQFEEIAQKYGLDLDEEWNKELLPHLERHPNEYHEFVLDSMKQFDEIAQGIQETFLDLYKNMKNTIRNNPDMLYKNYWNQ